MQDIDDSRSVPAATMTDSGKHNRASILWLLVVVSGATLCAQERPPDQAAAETELLKVTQNLKAMPLNGTLWYARGQLRLQLLDPVGALGDFSESIRLDPFNVDSRVSRGRLWAAQNRWLDVVADTTAGLAVEAHQVELLILRARARRFLGMNEAASADCDRAAEAAPQNPEIRMERAWVSLAQGNWARVLEDAGEATRALPDRLDGLMLQGIAHRELREWAPAVECFDRVIEKDPKNPVAFFNRARAQLELHQQAQALGDLDRTLEIDPTFGDAYLRRGTARLGGKDPAAALGDFTQFIRLNPNRAEGYVLRACAEERLGRYETASADAKTAETLGSNEPQLFGVLARLDERREDWNALLDHASRMLDQSPRDAEGYRLLGHAKRSTGDEAGALAAYSGAVERDPQDWKSFLELAAILSSRKAHPEVIALTSKAIELHPDTLQGYTLRAYAYFCQSRMSEAQADCEHALAIDSRQAMPLLVRARILLSQGAGGNALTDCQKAVALSPQSPWAYSTLGIVLAANGDNDGAIKALTRAIQLSPADAEARAARGKAHLALRRYRSATEDFEVALAADPSLEHELAGPMAELKSKR
jgi:tetratricopeptide (TPR) repeat protein